MVVDPDLQSVQEARQLVVKAAEAQKLLAQFSQEQIDAVVAAVAEAGRQHAEPLARLAVEETTYGMVADKVRKNTFAAEDVYRAIKGLKTVGIIREDRAKGVFEVAEPMGVVAAMIPCTNPTSTAIFKALIALKGRNTIVMSPHPAAVRCIQESARILSEAAVKAGAPEGSISCLSLPTMEATQELMRHRLTAVILATGSAGLVRAAYSSGKPAYGVGPGNVPAYIHSSANVRKAVADILAGKSFDNGTVCASEQTMVVDQAIADRVRAEAERQGGLFLAPQQAEAVARVLVLPNFRINPKLVGHSAQSIAQAAGISVPAHTRVLVVPIDGIGKQHPLSAEKLSPVLAFYVVNDCQGGMDACRRLLEFGGLGHTLAVHATDEHVIREFALRMPASRILINTPTTHGSVGDSANLEPSLSLGCGTWGGNITTDNISVMHLLNIKRVAYEVRPVNPGEAEETAVRTASAAPVMSASVPAAPGAAGAAVPDQAEIARVVDRFLARRGTAAPAPASKVCPAMSGDSSVGQPPVCPCVSSTAKTAARPAAENPPPAPRPVDFVSEDDVRQAINKNEKIYVTPRAIITPSARDLGNPREIFVIVK